MNPAAHPLQRHKTQAIAAVFGINLIFGALLVILYPDLTHAATAQAAMDELRGSPLYFGYELATLIACFLWLGLDSRQLEIRRPWWLNVGIVLLTFVFVPYYLYKTRAADRRIPAILGFLGVAGGAIVAMLVGMFFALSMQAATATQL